MFKPAVALLSAVILVSSLGGVESHAQNLLYNIPQNPNQMTFYSDDILIANCYHAKKEEEMIDNLRLADHSHSKKEMAKNIDEYFENNNCELAGYGETFVEAGLESQVDPYFLASISVIESTGGNHCVRRHNAWGRKAGGANGDKFERISANGWCTWPSWELAIRDEADYISRVYLDQGRTNVYSIARKYCPPTAGNWASNVRRVQRNMQNQ